MQNLRARKSTLSGPHIPVPTFPLSTPPVVNISLITVMIKAIADCRNVHSKLFYLDQNLRNFYLPYYLRRFGGHQVTLVDSYSGYIPNFCCSTLTKNCVCCHVTWLNWSWIVTIQHPFYNGTLFIKKRKVHNFKNSWFSNDTLSKGCIPHSVRV